MTGDIKSRLLASDAAKSMEMERAVVSAFHAAQWPTQRSAYYTDRVTGKVREIDILAQKHLQKPMRYRGVGAPTINFKVVCECKSLSGSNIILSEDGSSREDYSIQKYWIGNEDEIRDIVRTFLERGNVTNAAMWRAAHEFAVARAYHGEGIAISRPIHISPPPVDLVVRAFRETKAGELRDEEAAKANPLWNAIQSSLSTIAALRERSRLVPRSYISDYDYRFDDPDKMVRNFTFFFDSELARTVFFHPIVVLDAKMWVLDGEKLSQASSARIKIDNIDGNCVYVDVVNYSNIDEYVQKLTNQIEKQARKSIRGLWDLFEYLEWEPGGEEARLRTLLGLPPLDSPTE